MSATTLGSPPVKVYTSVDTIETVNITDFARSLLNDPSSTTARDTLGVTGSINSDMYASFDAAVAAIGSTETELIVTTQETLLYNLSTPSTLTIVVRNGGRLNVATGKTLTINGPFVAGLYQIFAGLGTVAFGYKSVFEVFPQWWGATGDDSTLCTDGINAAIATGMPVHITEGTWLCNITISNKVNVCLFGDSYDCVLKTFDGVNPVITINSNNPGGVQVIGTKIHDLKIDGDDGSEGLYMTATSIFVIQNSLVENIKFTKCTKSIHIHSGSSAEEVYFNKFRNIVIENIPAGAPGAPNFTHGIYSDGGVENIFQNVLIPLVPDYCYAIECWGTSNSFFDVVTDGNIRSSAANINWYNTTIETVYCAHPADATEIFRLDGGRSSVIGLNLVNCASAKIPIGLNLWGYNNFVAKVNAYGADQPTYAVYINEDASSGTICSVYGGTFTIFASASETRRHGWNILSAGETSVYRWASTSPAGGVQTWVVGDYVRNSSPSVGQPKGWVCTVAGTPGTWVSEEDLLVDAITTMANSATPSVANCRTVLTGGTTTITNLTNGITGQVLRILSDHAITITDGTNIFLSGSANFVMAAGDTLTLVCKTDGKWYELSRGDN